MLLFETPSGGRIGQDEWDFIGSVGCFGLALFVEHFLCIAVLMISFCGKTGGERLKLGRREQNLPMIRCDEQNVALLFTFFVYISNRPVCGCYGFDRGLIHPGVSHHVRRSEIVHYKLIFLL